MIFPGSNCYRDDAIKSHANHLGNNRRCSIDELDGGTPHINENSRSMTECFFKARMDLIFY